MIYTSGGLWEIKSPQILRLLIYNMYPRVIISSLHPGNTLRWQHQTFKIFLGEHAIRPPYMLGSYHYAVPLAPPPMSTPLHLGPSYSKLVPTPLCIQSLSQHFLLSSEVFLLYDNCMHCLLHCLLLFLPCAASDMELLRSTMLGVWSA